VSVILNLKNKIVREAYAKAIEAIEDRMDVEEANRRMNDGSELIPWEEAKKRIHQKTKINQ
jgi:predicted DNA-binding protein